MSTESSNLEKSNEKITSSSSPEEVVDFLSKRIKLSDEVIQKLKSEAISGDILLSLDDEDYKLLGIKLGPKKKIKKYLDENKGDFSEKEFDIKLSINSTKEEVKDFLEKSLGITEDVDLDGKSLLDLRDDDIENLGLNIGKKIRLKKYLKYLNNIKQKNPEKVEEQKEKE